MWTLARRDMDAHAGSAERKRSLKFSLGNHRTDAQPDAVEHQIGVVRIGIRLYADVRDLPALGAQMGAYCLLQRVSGKIRAHEKLLVANPFHRTASFES